MVLQTNFELVSGSFPMPDLNGVWAAIRRQLRASVILTRSGPQEKTAGVLSFQVRISQDCPVHKGHGARVVPRIASCWI